MMFLGWLQERRCQYCDNMIGKWSAVIGVRNCSDCVFRMQMGQAPRCRVTGCTDPDHGHPRPPMAA